MKLTKFAQWIVLGLVLAVAASGCRSKQGYFTRIPANQGGSTGGLKQSPPPLHATIPMDGGDTSSKLPPDNGPSAISSTPVPVPPITTQGISSNGIPQGPGHPGWPEDRKALENETVHFAFDSSTVRPGDKPKVSAVAEYLKSNAAVAVKIEGHCDERGTAEYNRALGERRALALREELVGLGVASDRLDTISYGFDKPVALGHDEEAWKQNRRGEFIVLTPPVQ